MRFSEFKNALQTMNAVTFLLPDGSPVPSHYHVTEVGLEARHFIDCGGTVRRKETISLQLWTSIDTDHRLQAEKLRNILALSEKTLALPDLEVEVEYQGETIGRYGLRAEGGAFHLQNLFTDCLATDACGVPGAKPRVQLSELGASNTTCKPGGGCC